jgi:hypothetical protein
VLKSRVLRKMTSHQRAEETKLIEIFYIIKKLKTAVHTIRKLLQA